MTPLAADARETTLTILASRAGGGSVCPSEVARAICPGADWRTAMPIVHAAVDGLVDEEMISLSWKGKPLSTRAGPYRIGRV